MDFSFDIIDDNTLLATSSVTLRDGKPVKLAIYLMAETALVSDAGTFLFAAPTLEDGEAFLRTEAARVLLNLYGVRVVGFELHIATSRALVDEAMETLAMVVGLLSKHCGPSGGDRLGPARVEFDT